MSPCRACGSTRVPVKIWDCPEMMRGSGERFNYGECAECASLWLLAVPRNLGDYYGASYYSFGATWQAAPAWRRLLKRARDAWQLWGHPWWGAALARRSRYPELDSLRRAGLKPGLRLLDVGCGDGLLVHSLAMQGLQTTGIDPFLAQDSVLTSGARLLRSSIEAMQGEFDWVTLNHSLEHMESPMLALQAAFNLLVPGGHCLVRIPTCSSQAWQEFGPHWIQLDPPRHLVLFSRAALTALAQSQGWSVKMAFDDSGSFQFWGSLQARQGIHLEDGRSVSHGGSPFTSAEMKGFNARAEKLNAEGRGDSLALVLMKPLSAPNS